MNVVKIEDGVLIIGHEDTYFSKVKLTPGKHLIEVEILLGFENFVAVDNPKVKAIYYHELTPKESKSGV